MKLSIGMLLGALILGIFLVRAGAEEISPMQQYEMAVWRCVTATRAQSRYGIPFDAYIERGSTTITYFGSQYERYLFTRCMNAEGYPMEVVSNAR